VNSRPRERRWTPAWPVDLTTTLGVLQHGPRDPTMQASAGQVWRTTRTPEGPATVHYRRSGPDVVVRAWGPGAQTELDAVPDVLGRSDDPEGFAHDAHPAMAAAHRRFGSGWRVIRTRRVLEALVPAILEQRVTGREASAAWARLVREFGDPAPGPTAPAEDQAHPALFVAPDGPTWARIPSWAWHRAGVDPGHARTITTAAQRATALEALSTQPPSDAGNALRTLPGIGVWTAAEVGVRAWGDRDAVSFGDFHLARVVVHALTGRTDGDDAQMAALLTPWDGQRSRAVRLLVLHAGHTLPRRAPRAAITDHRGW
jgi:3-methyladenine DNA glycosylase/8-oxoguanine DNA glycosylase